MRSEIASVAYRENNLSLSLSLASKWLTLEQAVGDVQKLRPHEMRWAGLAKRRVVVHRDVAGGDAVLDAEDAHGELPLEEWLTTIIAARSADEYTDNQDAQHANESLHNDNVLSSTL